MNFSILKVFLIVFLALLIKANSFACTCQGMGTFIKSIGQSHIVFSGKIISQIQFPNGGYRTYRSITEIEIIKWYQNALKTDTLYFLNASSFMCHQSFEFSTIGETYIFNTTARNIANYEHISTSDKQSNSFFENYRTKSFIGSSICYTNSLKVVDEMVIGNITKNLFHQNYKFINLVRKLNSRLAELLETNWNKNLHKEQIMTLEKFDKIMHKKNSI